jgi:predicted transcriptional regulator
MLDDIRKLPDGKALDPSRARRLLGGIEQARMAAAMSVADLARRAGVSESYYHKLRAGQHLATARTLRRMATALQARAPLAARDVIEQMAFDGLVGKLLAVDSMSEAQARAQAIYITHVEFGVTQTRAAALAGVSQQFVGKVTRQLEDRRDMDPAFERRIQTVLTPQYARESRA